MATNESGIPEKQVLVITGPTASGKSALALNIARTVDGEIVSADSRQIYREITIGSAKPSEEELCEIRHHFINEKSIGETFTAGEFASEASERIRAIQRRGKYAVVVGGSTLYIEGLLKGFADLPPGDPEIRRRLTAELDRYGSEKLYENLRKLDPDQAEKLDASKTHRLIRSLEIIAITGKTVTELQLNQNIPFLKFRTIGLNMPRTRLYERINMRVDSMIDAGLCKEAAYLYETYYCNNSSGDMSALNTVGYKELFHFFDGRTSFAAAVTLIKQHTRNYAKRQLTFFKNRLNVNWVDVPDDSAAMGALIAECCRALHEA
ncbi:MAG: tRNA (adenosine(37)-N6)-dimethylallyltransferase MiaA [Chlorobium sp.]|uniref:tRNA (adenosine(37)-N6)-dimethylallyltransferase MiaA n=1 Tax=Chlorobium sp. TaxID=1095 RepID=UPI0025BF6283|nr:tRNA (adenosine(37)-N6)-dimethylallyltransferase MiaA [Chlorobium sp.]MCF8216057.1 tRNA (adenosine(37)-N6)-dimethylallyltransferase MiaA [Chlorobium sp.]MCF8270958.1 tRNA (adenosine(37)-N6)-dimethylallyltransferase MiaA [Chlorobium sp.]MCF8287332.1 tRNA (adenosine(37)-N6)-dimethylallyltransferase MiaA [Chlorobium sp.]MCF8291418.1 tRNA (adenosine(37)-N6)-dimethylallyltransferase MiaA [Chlorobium sp.]MCF8384966.1 tRNA (adenosine(37)-N6)-dimethylallyltransferase MiaA [Chlorobium sp.]